MKGLFLVVLAVLAFGCLGASAFTTASDPETQCRAEQQAWECGCVASGGSVDRCAVESQTVYSECMARISDH